MQRRRTIASVYRPRRKPHRGAGEPPRRQKKKGGYPVKFARTCAGFGAVLSAGIVLALACDHLAALLDAALMI